MFTDSAHVLMSTVAQQSVPIAVATDQRSFQSYSSGVLTASRDMLYQLFGVGALAHRGLSLHRRLVRGLFPAPHHHGPNEMLLNFCILGHGGCTWQGFDAAELAGQEWFDV